MRFTVNRGGGGGPEISLSFIFSDLGDRMGSFLHRPLLVRVSSQPRSKINSTCTWRPQNRRCFLHCIKIQVAYEHEDEKTKSLSFYLNKSNFLNKSICKIAFVRNLIYK